MDKHSSTSKLERDNTWINYPQGTTGLLRTCIIGLSAQELPASTKVEKAVDMSTARRLTWDEFTADIATLAHRINSHSLNLDAIVAVARGGWVPARMLSEMLEIPRLHSLRIDKSSGQHDLPSVVGQKILVVEDATVSGKTLQSARMILADSQNEAITTALYAKSDGTHLPDIYLRQIDELPLFPWERGV